MAKLQVQVDSNNVWVNFDDPPSTEHRYRGLAYAQLVDEITVKPVDTPVLVSTDLIGGTTKSSIDGIAGVAAVPARIPKSVKNFTMTFIADGYLPEVCPVTLPNTPVKPTTILARRNPVLISGRLLTKDQNGELVPCDNAQVSIAGVWRLQSEINASQNPPDVAIAAYANGLYLNRKKDDTLLAVDDSQSLAPDLSLTECAPAGSTRIKLDQVGGLASGVVVKIDGGEPELCEFMVVSKLEAPLSPSSPVTAELTYPLKRSHAPGATAQVLNGPLPAVAGGGAASLKEDARSGDATLFVDSVANLAATQVVRISSLDGQPDEYGRLDKYQANSNADGIYRLPLLHRVAAVQINADQPPPPAATISATATFSLSYDLYDNRQDLLLK